MENEILTDVTLTKDDKDLFLKLILKNLELKQCFVTPDMFKHIKQFNLETGKPYTGKNKFLLILLAEYFGYDDPRWATFKQANNAGCKIKKGEKGVVLKYINHFKTVPEKDKDGKIILDEDGEPKTKTVYLPKPIINKFVVFNGNQMENIPEYNTHLLKPDNFTQIADDFIASSKCKVTEKVSEYAYYSNDNDSITIPLRDSFNNSATFLHTVLHEMSHSTGHETRLNRDTLKSYHKNKQTKAMEELIAEMSATFIMLDLELDMSDASLNDTIGYISSWIKNIKDKPEALEKVCETANHISNFLIKNYKDYLKEKIAVTEKIA